MTLMQAKRARPPPLENEIISEPKDASFDDFNDVNDEMLAMIYNVVSQYQKMGGVLKATGAGVRGGARMRGGAPSEGDAPLNNELSTASAPEPIPGPTRTTQEVLNIPGERDTKKVLMWARDALSFNEKADYTNDKTLKELWALHALAKEAYPIEMETYGSSKTSEYIKSVYEYIDHNYKKSLMPPEKKLSFEEMVKYEHQNAERHRAEDPLIVADYASAREYLDLPPEVTLFEWTNNFISKIAPKVVDGEASIIRITEFKYKVIDALKIEETLNGDTADSASLITLIDLINVKLRLNKPEAPVVEAAEAPVVEAAEAPVVEAADAAAEQPPPEAAQEVLSKSPQTYLKTHGYPKTNDKKRVPGVVKRWAESQSAAVAVKHGDLAPDGKTRLVGMERDALITLREVAPNTLIIEENVYTSGANQEALTLLIIDIDAKLAKNLPPNVPLAPVEPAPELRTLEKEFDIKGIDAKKVIAVLVSIKDNYATLNDKPPEFWDGEIIKIGEMRDIETESRPPPKAARTTILKEIDLIIATLDGYKKTSENKADSMRSQSEADQMRAEEDQTRAFDRDQAQAYERGQTQAATELYQAEAEQSRAAAESAKTDAEIAKTSEKYAKSMIGESGNTTLPGLLSDIMKLSNKMFRLVKIKRDEWKTSVPVRDLKEVYDKVAEYNKKFSEINVDDHVMGGYRDMHKLASQRLGQLNEEFSMLVRTSNLNNSVNVPFVTGGRRRFVGENEITNVLGL